MAGKEKLFENKIKKFLSEHNCYYVKYFANRNTRSGVPDILACVNGHFVAIEVKAEDGKPTELQKWNVDKIRECGGVAMIVYPSDWEHFVSVIEGVLKCK